MYGAGHAHQTAPAPIADRPLPLIDVVDGAFAAVRQRPKTLIGVVAGLVIPASLAEGFLARNALGGTSFSEILDDPTVAQEASQSGSGFGAAAMTYGLDWLVIAIAGVAVSRIVGGWLQGADLGVRETVSFTARRLGVILIAFFLNHIAQLVGFVLLVVPGAIAVVLFSLTSPVIAIEDVGPIEALKRSAALAQRRKGSVVGAIAMTAAVAYGVDNAVGLLPTFVALFLGPDRTWPLISVASMLSSLILVPFTAATMCLVYFDIRFRTEGLDLQVRASKTFPAAPPATQPAPPTR